MFTEVCLSWSKTVSHQRALALTFFTSFDFGSAFVLSIPDQLSVCLVPANPAPPTSCLRLSEQSLTEKASKHDPADVWPLFAADHSASAFSA